MNQKVGGTIYGIEKDDKLFYIGKTNRNSVRKNVSKSKSNHLNISDATYQYGNQELRNLITSKSFKIVALKDVNADEWYDEKLLEVINHHKKNHPLMNSQWMLDGCRGYWENKTRDANTLKRLSESKYIRFVEYDVEGKLKKIWSSGKEVGTEVFKDYRVVNGSAVTCIYSIAKRKLIRNRFRNNSYWFSESELIKHFGIIPKKINIDAIIKQQKIDARRCESNINRILINKYTVERLDDNMNVTETFLNVNEAAFKLKLNLSTVKQLCHGRFSKSKYKLRYGKKVKQLISIQYPKYKTLPHIIHTEIK